MVICRAIVMAQDSDSSMYKVYRAQRDREGGGRREPVELLLKNMKMEKPALEIFQQRFVLYTFRKN